MVPDNNPVAKVMHLRIFRGRRIQNPIATCTGDLEPFPAMTEWVIAAFVFVYAGLILGGIPGLRIDRAGIAVLGAIFLLATEAISERDALLSIDFPTLALLFGLMIVAAQFQLGGFYAAATERLGAIRHRPAVLLAMVVTFAGGLSALLSNDVVCVAIAPPLLALCGRHRMNPVPFLLALACAANVGSAATLIGNPQNILIAQSLDLSFVRYLLVAIVPTVLGLAATWAVLAWTYRNDWEGPERATTEESPPFNPWQTAKGFAILAAIVVVFIGGFWPRELVALAGGAVLLVSRRFHSRRILGMVDWPLLLLFISLFIVNDAFERTGGSAEAVAALTARGLNPANPAVLFAGSAILSNIVSNVPAVMLLLPFAKTPESGIVMAIASTLAGNLLVVGSVANIIVIETGRRAGVPISFRTHARIGIPVTLATLAIAAAWLWLVL
jgi:Na+/H+ antiporter NhaD and related arsenite permeases